MLITQCDASHNISSDTDASFSDLEVTVTGAPSHGASTLDEFSQPGPSTAAGQDPASHSEPGIDSSSSTSAHDEDPSSSDSETSSSDDDSDSIDG